MANATFQSRIERIQKAHAKAHAAPAKATFRTPGIAGVAALHNTRRRRRNPLREHMAAIALGVVMGCLVAVGLLGLSMENAPWGVGSAYHDIAYIVTMGGLGLAPVLMLLAMLLATRRPGFALFSLGYLSGVVVPLFI